MTVIELREKLIEKIRNTDNEELLDHISDMIDFQKGYGEVYQVTGEELVAVKEGLRQLDEGKWISNDESNKRVDEWLKKFDGH